MTDIKRETKMPGSKHTPGPRRIVEQTRIEADEYGLLASLRGEVSPHYETVTDANARLIAAAPDLLAYAECSAALDREKVDPAYDAQPVLRSHGWNGQGHPGLFLSRIRRHAIESATGSYLGRAS